MQCKFIDAERLVLLLDADSSAHARFLKATDQSAIGGFKIELPPKYPFDFTATKSGVFVHNYPVRAIELHLYETQAKSLSFDFQPYHIEISAIAASDDSKRFALGDRLGALTIWEVDLSTPSAIVKGLPPIARAVFSESGDKLAVAFETGLIAVFMCADTNSRAVLELHKSQITAMAFAGKNLLSCDAEGRLAVWNLGAIKAERVYPLKSPARSIAPAFGSKAAIVACEGGQFLALDLTRDQKPLSIDALGESLVAACFNEQTEQAVLVTAAWNLLFFNLAGDKPIESYLAPAETQKSAIGESYKAIVVDDSVTMRRIISAAIREEYPSIEIFEAANGAEALETLAQNHDAKAMFLDWNMPTMSGEQVVEKIKEAKIYPQLQIIMATTEGGQEKVLRMLKMGVAGYLVKPFRREAIVKIMGKLLEKTA